MLPKTNRNKHNLSSSQYESTRKALANASVQHKQPEQSPLMLVKTFLVLWDDEKLCLLRIQPVRIVVLQLNCE